MIVIKGQSNTEGPGVIYELRCLDNNKVYIGQTNNFKRRCWEHLNELRNNKHKNYKLQQDYNFYGESRFIFSILETQLTRFKLIERETYYINLNGGIDSESTYNMQDKYFQNREMRLLNSKGQTGKMISSTTKDKISKSEKLYYKCNGGDHEAAFKGRHHTVKTKQILSDKLSKNAKINPNFGMKNKHHSIESRKKMSETRKQKMSEIRLKIIKYTPDVIEEIRQKYEELGTYKKVSEIYNISPSSICNLLKYGTTSKNKKCNDYPL